MRDWRTFELNPDANFGTVAEHAILHCAAHSTVLYQLYSDALSCSPCPYFLGLTAGYCVTKYTAFPYSEYFTAVIPEICRHVVD